MKVGQLSRFSEEKIKGVLCSTLYRIALIPKRWRFDKGREIAYKAVGAPQKSAERPTLEAKKLQVSAFFRWDKVEHQKMMKRPDIATMPDLG